MIPRPLGGVFAAVGAAGLVALGLPARAAPPPPGSAAAPPSPVSAAPGSGLIFDFPTLSKAKVGAWAEYAMSKQGGGEKSVTVRYALVERSPVKIGLEVDTKTPKGGFLMRSDFGLTGPETWKLMAMTMKVGDQRLDLPQAQIAQTPTVKSTDPPGELLGTETITTPLGPFVCKHYKKVMSSEAKAPTLELWISDKIAPTGLVKSALIGTGVEMMLAANGEGAQPILK